MKIFKICYYPRYDIRGGSSRCRAYYIQQKLVEMGVDAYLQSAPYTSDVIVFQKTYEKPYVNIARKAKEKGIKIVFDLDDDYQSAEMIKIADVVVCDSQGLVDFAQGQVRKKIDGRVILNPVDYIKKPLPKRIHKKKNNLRFVYFANPANFKAFLNCRGAMERLREEGYKYSLTLLGGNSFKHIQKYGDPFKGFKVEHIPWALDTFSKNLQTFDIAILPQAWDWKGPAKQTEAVAHNLAAICEKIQPNESLYKEADLMEYLAGTEEEWYQATKKLFDPKERSLFCEKVLPVVWKRRSHEQITKEWLSLFRELANERN